MPSNAPVSTITILSFLRLLFLMTLPSCKPPKGLQLRPFGQFMKEQVQMAFTVGRYAYVGAPIGISLVTKTAQADCYWEPWDDLTKSLPTAGCTLASNEVLVATYDYHADHRQPVLATGMFVDTGRRVPSGFVQLEVWRLEQKFLDAFAAAHPRELKYLARKYPEPVDAQS